jgi:hypothetical protein
MNEIIWQPYVLMDTMYRNIYRKYRKYIYFYGNACVFLWKVSCLVCSCGVRLCMIGKPPRLNFREVNHFYIIKHLKSG